MAPLVVPGCQQVLFACDTLNCLCTACASRKLIQLYPIKHSLDSLLCISPPAGFQHFCHSIWCHCWCYRIFANTFFLEVYFFQRKSPKTIIRWPHCACYCLMYSIFFGFGCQSSFVFNMFLRFQFCFLFKLAYYCVLDWSKGASALGCVALFCFFNICIQ